MFDHIGDNNYNEWPHNFLTRVVPNYTYYPEAFAQSPLDAIEDFIFVMSISHHLNCVRPPRCEIADVLTCRYKSNLTLKEISRTLDVPISCVQQYLTYADNVLDFAVEFSKICLHGKINIAQPTVVKLLRNGLRTRYKIASSTYYELQKFLNEDEIRSCLHFTHTDKCHKLWNTYLTSCETNCELVNKVELGLRAQPSSENFIYSSSYRFQLRFRMDDKEFYHYFCMYPDEVDTLIYKPHLSGVIIEKAGEYYVYHPSYEESHSVVHAKSWFNANELYYTANKVAIYPPGSATTLDSISSEDEITSTKTVTVTIPQGAIPGYCVDGEWVVVTDVK